MSTASRRARAMGPWSGRSDSQATDASHPKTTEADDVGGDDEPVNDTEARYGEDESPA
jgi:hypothetical protein